MLEPEPELEPELEPEPELGVELEPGLEAELVDAGGFETGELAGVELPVLLFGAAACCGPEDGWLAPSHLPPAQIEFQSSLSKVPGGYVAGSLNSVRFSRSTSVRSRLCLCICWCVG